MSILGIVFKWWRTPLIQSSLRPWNYFIKSNQLPTHPLIRTRSTTLARQVGFILLLAGGSAFCAWQDEIGFTRLQTLAGAEIPTAPAAGLSQIEALEFGANYSPNTLDPAFFGKSFTLKSGSTGTSTHATHVGKNFYGLASQIPGATDVDLYNADDWINSDFLRMGSNNVPRTESRGVQNHSWIVNTGWTTSQVEEANKRLDYAIHRDGFVCVVGENNVSSTILPQFLGQSYHTISVGRDDGVHNAGFTAYDGTGRIKPDIVAPSAAPEYATSWTTPMVAGAAGLLYAKLTADHPTLTAPDFPRVIKALLLASATKNTVPGWDNSSARPLDDIYGAGELNVHHAYLALRGGRATANTTYYGIRGWASESASGSSTETYYFTIPAGAPSTPFSAALIWHRAVSKSGFNTWSSTLANLNLRLHHATGTTLGSAISESLSSVDNVELVYQSTLAPGDYALVVENTSTTNTPYALAWHSLPAVTIAATTPLAREIDGQAGEITLVRSGDTTLPLYVPLSIGGTAIPGTHYTPLPPDATFAAGQDTLTLQVIPVSDSLAQGDRTVLVSVAADFALVRDPTQSSEVTIEDKPFDAWRFANFTTPELANSTISSESADPDHDQLANLIEYALGLPPKSPSTSPVTTSQPGGYLALSASKSPGATDISWAAEVSGDLNDWSPAIITIDTPSTFEARDSILIEDAPKRFIRLKISR